MRYITKDYNSDVVLRHESELQSQHLDEQSLLDPNIYPGLSGNKLWKKVRDIKVIPHLWDLKHQMYDEQGGICCYCGLRIFKDSDGRKMTVEHLIPKGIHRELVGEYKNLLLSCSVIEDDVTVVEQNSLDTSSLSHCDDSKKDMPLHYTPLMRECETVFQYDIVGGVHAEMPDAQVDIATLRLDCDLLKNRRKAALNILFDEDGQILSDEELRMIADKIMSLDEDKNLPEFCFVIKNVIDSLL